MMKNRLRPNFLCVLVALFAVLFILPSHAAETMTVRVKDGRVQEYVNGSLRRSYGANIVDVASDGQLVVAVNSQGRIQEYVNGSLRRTYGNDVVRVRVSGGSVFADLRNRRTAEYLNGNLRRTF